MARVPLNRFNGLRAIYVLTFVLIIAVFLILYWLIVSYDRKVESCTLCLETSECPTTFNEKMLGDFVRIPAGYFILPKHLKKTGYDIDSVYVNSFYLAVGKVSLDAYKSVFCPKDENARVRSLNNSINHLEQKEIGVFLFRVNQLSDYHYRIPNDVEWMYAYQYLSEINISPKLQSEAPLKFHGIVSSFIQEPFEMCSWEGRRETGDTVSNFAFSEDLLSSNRNFITKGDIENIYNRDAQAFPSGIRLVRF
jgi:hypothetical protein